MRYTILLFLLMPLLLSAQETCNGNLGADIFEDGDFGSGFANMPSTDPGIAPGYTYTTSPPPNDGFYTITNNTAPWPLFPGWLGIRDNSDDPNGYMMVVNASYETGAFYDKEIEGLCENTLYEFSADIINLIQPNSPGFIFPNVSFLLDDVVQYTTGNIAQTGQWVKYGFTFTTVPGQTSVRLTLRNNAPGGFGNDLALDNISFRACGPEALILPLEVENICEDGDPIPLTATIVGEQYADPAVQWQQSFDGGANWVDMPGETGESILHTDLAAGFYYYRYLLASDANNLQNDKCRVISNIKVVFVQPKAYTVVDTVCEGGSYELGNSTYDQTGMYTDSLLSSLGCDSIVTLDLTIVPDQGITAQFAAEPPLCPGFSDGQIAVEGVKNTYVPYQIEQGGTIGDIPQALFDNLAAGDYPISITDTYGCRLDTVITVPVSDIVTTSLPPDQTVLLGEGVQVPLVTASTGLQVSWSPSESVFCNGDCLAPYFQPGETTTYFLTSSTPEGCTVVDSFTISVEVVRQVYIPTAFSPNGDGRNDRFTVYANVPNVQEVALLQVFDRWGGLVYEERNRPPNDPASGWDGQRRGDEPLPVGTYTYLARIRFLDGQELVYAGHVNLLR